MLSFCNNSGPAFILGAVGAGIFSNSMVGWLLYLAHAVASLTVGLVFRFYKYNEQPREQTLQQSAPVIRVSQAFTGAVRSSFDAILGVCAFVIFFAVAIRMLYSFGVLGFLGSLLGHVLAPFGVGADVGERILSGMIEVTSGLWALQSINIAIAQKLAMAAFMLGWAGLSIHCQVLTFIGKSGLTAWTYVVGKLLHGVLSTVYIVVLLKLFDFGLPVSSYLLEQVNGISTMDFGRTLGATLQVTLAICIALVFIGGVSLLKRNWKRI